MGQLEITLVPELHAAPTSSLDVSGGNVAGNRSQCVNFSLPSRASPEKFVCPTTVTPLSDSWST